MKNKLVIILTLLTFIAYGQNKNVTINNYQFTFKTISENNEDGDSIKKIEVFRDKTKLLSHTIYEISGDHNSEAVELGSYNTSDSTITFYSYWNRAGDAPVSPYGVRKQIYTVDRNGKLILIDSEIYIETSRQGWKENKGIEFLFSAPQNDFDKKELKDYISSAEKDYDAKFVFGTTKELLFKEVKTKLKSQIEKATKNWKMTYGDKFGGFKL